MHISFATIAFLVLAGRLCAGEEPDASNPKIEIRQAVALAKQMIHSGQVVHSAIYTLKPHWGHIWIVETDAPQPEALPKSELFNLITPPMFQVRIKTEKLIAKNLINSALVAHYKEGAAHELRYAQVVTGKPGFCVSPHARFSNYVDARLFEPGEIILCPYTGLPFLVPS
jgi:hypothetical protein